MGQRPFDLDAFREFEQTGWNRRLTAAEYQRFFEAVTGRAIEPLLDAAGVRAGMKVLDAGTGPGHVAARVAARGAWALGVDFSGEMISLARSLNPSVEFQQADVERLPFPDRAFDAVVGNFVIPHLARPEQAMAGFARVLVSGGRLALSTWDVRDQARLIGIFYDAVEEAGAKPPADLPSGPSFFRFSPDSEFSTLLRGGGFEAVEVRRVSFVHTLSGPDELWEGMLRGGVRAPALILGQTPEMQQRIRLAFDRLARPYVAGGRLEMPVSVKIASGCLRAR